MGKTKSKYNDIPSVIQVIANLYVNPSLLDNEKYTFIEDDFTEPFHQVLFGSIYNLYQLGAKKITLNSIEDYLSSRPNKMVTYQANKGSEYLEKIVENIQGEAFDYYYYRIKKMTLFRAYSDIGMDLSWLYDVDNILDVDKKQKQEEWIDAHSLEEIADEINYKIENIKYTYANNVDNEMEEAGGGLDELIESYLESPDYGIPMYGDIMNTVLRGARLGKVVLRSAATGIGKTRSMVADIATFSCSERYDLNKKEWISLGQTHPSLFIATEQSKADIQTLLLAFIAGVNSAHIEEGTYYDGELDRVRKASHIISKSKLYIISIPDFSLVDIENTIKMAIREYDVKFVAFDYVHSTMKILSEISSRARVAGLREDNILFMLGVKLKDLAVQYNVFIITGTQLNMSYKETDTPDQNCLRGAKSLADKVDAGLLMLDVTTKDLEILQPLIGDNKFEQPDIKISVYKNRATRWEHIYIWCKADKGTCQIVNPLFVTNWRYEIQDIPMTKITIEEKPKTFAESLSDMF